jgi:hypothetical protein
MAIERASEFGDFQAEYSRATATKWPPSASVGIGGCVSPQPSQPVSGPETWVTDYAEEMGNTFDPKGFARGSSLQIVRPVTGTPERAVDYVFKTIPRGRVS